MFLPCQKLPTIPPAGVAYLLLPTQNTNLPLNEYFPVPVCTYIAKAPVVNNTWTTKELSPFVNCPWLNVNIV